MEQLHFLWCYILKVFLQPGEIFVQPRTGFHDASVHSIDEYALASRLSYFLWSSMPDEELFGLAGKGRLRRDLAGQVRRMLRDPRAHALVENFADPDVGCASGELMLGDPRQGEVTQGMGLYWRIEKNVRELESKSGSVVGATGALYATRRNLLVAVPREISGGSPVRLNDVPLRYCSRGSIAVNRVGAATLKTTASAPITNAAA